MLICQQFLFSLQYWQIQLNSISSYNININPIDSNISTNLNYFDLILILF